jgi:ATP-dependent phosphofructokinase / diphosphate-dependent phosphofructokinase
VKKIGVMTTGGDCAGLNAAIRAVTLRAHSLGVEVLGFKYGSDGVVSRDYINLHPGVVTYEYLTRGGSVLGCMSKGGPLKYLNDDGVEVDIAALFAESYRALNLDCLITIGGDGSFSIMHSLVKRFRLNCIGIPKTIDNDLACTDISIGYSTSVQSIVDSIDKLQTTAESHQRIIVVQVMGRDAGHLALASGIAAGADIVLIPEIQYKKEVIAQHLNEIYSTGKKFAIVVVSEAIKREDGTSIMVRDFVNRRDRYEGAAHYICCLIESMTSLETRPVVLGHVQRGGSPIAIDRLLASQFGVHAVDLAMKQEYGRVVVLRNNTLSSTPIENTISAYNSVDLDSPLIYTARGLGLCLGDI